MSDRVSYLCVVWRNSWPYSTVLSSTVAASRPAPTQASAPKPRPRVKRSPGRHCFSVPVGIPYRLLIGN